MPTEQEQIEALKKQLHEALETVDHIKQILYEPNFEIRWPFAFTSMNTGYEEGKEMLTQILALDHVKEARVDGGNTNTQLFWISVNENLYQDLFDKISAIVYRNMTRPPST